MKRPNREINIFNMSALDLFASALGAFIIITVILFPYYLKNSEAVQKMREAQQQAQQAQQQLQQTQQQLAQCQQQNAQQQQQLQQAQQQTAQCLAKLSQTFLAVVMKWPTAKHDVDLHVVNPAGQEFYYSKNNRNRQDYADAAAELSVDTIHGPGIEIWEQAQADPGSYQVYYNLYSRHEGGPQTPVSGNVYYRDGMKKLPDITLSREQTKVPVATIVVGAQGEVTVQ